MQEPQSSPGTLFSDRLILSRISPEDSAAYLAWARNEQVMQFSVSGRTQLPIEEAMSSFNERLAETEKYPEIGTYSVKLRNNNPEENIGFGFLMYENENEKDVVEVGYILMPPYWGQGYATEILGVLVKHAKTCPNIKRLFGWTHPNNNKSKRVLLKHNFVWYKNVERHGLQCEYFELVLQK